jgi:hypothetical protein
MVLLAKPMTTIQKRAGTPLAMSCSRKYVVRDPVSTSDERRREEAKSAASGRAERDVDDESANRADGAVRADDDRAEAPPPVPPAVGLGATNALATEDDDTRCARKAKRAKFIVAK